MEYNVSMFFCDKTSLESFEVFQRIYIIYSQIET